MLFVGIGLCIGAIQAAFGAAEPRHQHHAQGTEMPVPVEAARQPGPIEHFDWGRGLGV